MEISCRGTKAICNRVVDSEGKFELNNNKAKQASFSMSSMSNINYRPDVRNKLHRAIQVNYHHMIHINKLK